jgi:hypothetical protein
VCVNSVHINKSSDTAAEDLFLQACDPAVQRLQALRARPLLPLRQQLPGVEAVPVAGRHCDLGHQVPVAPLGVALAAQVVVLADQAGEPAALDGLSVVAAVAEVPVVDVQALVLALAQTQPLRLRHPCWLGLPQGLPAVLGAAGGGVVRRRVGGVLAQLELDHVA